MFKLSKRILSINQKICKGLLYSLPVNIATLVWAYSTFDSGKEPEGVLWDLAGWFLIISLVLFLYILFSLVVNRSFREDLLTRMTFSKERDERESYISGRASKSTFLSTLAILIVFFCLSSLRIHIEKKPKEEIVDGKKTSLSIGFKFAFERTSAIKSVKPNDRVIFSSDGIPFTQEVIFLFLILFHTGSYHFFSRKTVRE